MRRAAGWRASRRSVGEPHRQCSVGVEDEPLERLELLRRYREGHLGEPGEQRRQRDARLHPGQRRAQAVVHSVAEGQVLLAGAGEVELLRGGAVQFGVAARGAERDEDRLTRRDGETVEFDVLDGEPQRYVLDGTERVPR